MATTRHTNLSEGPQTTGRGWDVHVRPRPGSVTDVASLESRRAATTVDLGTRLRNSTPVRRAFVRGLEEPLAPSPLLRLYRGGRSGVVPIRLYLALLWKCSKAPYETTAPARAWATLLDLQDPAGAGARRIRAALDKLQDHRLITTSGAPGEVTTVTLLREDGTGRKYIPPSGAYLKAQAGKRGQKVLEQHRYFKINSDLWTGGHLQVLTGPALVMLLIILGEGGDRAIRGEGGDQALPVWFSTSLFKERYGLSPATRAQGVRELVERGLLLVDRAAVPDRPGGSVFDRQRYRDIYTLTGPALVDDEERATRRKSGQLRHAAAGAGDAEQSTVAVTLSAWESDA